MKSYCLEIYHWDKDYWSTVGIFATKELALQWKSYIEEQDSMISCTLFEKEIIDTLDNFVT